MERRAYTGRNKEKKRVLRRSGKTPELHCMLIPTHRETLLLPTSVMAEVVDYTAPRPAEDAPPWLLGQIDWENRQVPVFSFGALINGTGPDEVSRRARIMVLKSVTERASSAGRWWTCFAKTACVSSAPSIPWQPAKSISTKDCRFPGKAAFFIH